MGGWAFFVTRFRKAVLGFGMVGDSVLWVLFDMRHVSIANGVRGPSRLRHSDGHIYNAWGVVIIHGTGLRTAIITIFTAVQLDPSHLLSALLPNSPIAIRYSPSSLIIMGNLYLHLCGWRGKDDLYGKQCNRRSPHRSEQRQRHDANWVAGEMGPAVVCCQVP